MKNWLEESEKEAERRERWSTTSERIEDCLAFAYDVICNEEGYREEIKELPRLAKVLIFFFLLPTMIYMLAEWFWEITSPYIFFWRRRKRFVDWED